jgi:DNA-binding phage protein
MLRVSSQTTQTEIDLHGIEGDAEAAAQGIEFGAELMRLAEALAARDAPALAAARAALLERAGPAVLVDAAGVAANFQRMVRIADSIGIPVDNLDTEVSREVRGTLLLARFHSARNTPGSGAAAPHS